MVDAAESNDGRWLGIGKRGPGNVENLDYRSGQCAAGPSSSFCLFLPKNKACMCTIEECRCACSKSAPFELGTVPLASLLRAKLNSTRGGSDKGRCSGLVAMRE